MCSNQFEWKSGVGHYHFSPQAFPVTCVSISIQNFYFSLDSLKMGCGIWFRVEELLTGHYCFHPRPGVGNLRLASHMRLFSSIRKYYLFYKKKTIKNRSESINEVYLNNK
jgi:hypothetical protein